MGLRTRTIAAQVANSFSNAAAAQPLTLTSNVTFEKVTSNTVSITTANATTVVATTANVTTLNTVDAVVTGNLTVSGTTTYVNTTNLNIGDNIITLNADLGASAPSENAGFEVNRGTSANVAILWDESIDRWVATNDGTTYANIAIGAAGATLTANGTDTATYYLPMSSATTGSWTNAVVDTSLTFVPSTNTLSAGIISIASGLYPTSNTVGTALGSSTQRWVLIANTGTFSGAVSGITTLAAGNTTITGFANVTSTIQGGAGLTIAGAASGITTLAAGNTTITGFANVSSTLQVTGAVTFSNTLSVAGNVTGTAANVTIVAGSFTSTFANTGATSLPGSLAITGALSGVTTAAVGNTTVTGFANVSGTLQVGANVVLGTTTITANGGVGTAGQVLTSGATGNVYWSTISTTLDSVLAAGNTTTKALTTGTLTVNGAIRTTTAFIENATAVTADYTITANTNAMTAGPITIANTATVTIPSDSNWIIL